MGKKTALYDMHVLYGGRIVEYAGYDLSVEFAGLGLVKEHKSVREGVGVFDVSHMGEIEITGKEAALFTQYLMTNDLTKIVSGQIIYTYFCQEDGGVIDDLLVYKYSDEHLLLVVNAANIEKDVAWVKKHATKFEVTVTDRSSEIAQIALQGPRAEAVLQKLVDIQLSEEIKFFRFKDDVLIASVPCLVSRTGYTGEDGFEIYCANEQIETVFLAIMKAGEEEGIKPAGLGCRDTLRFEANLPLYGHELSEKITPIEAGYGFFVKTDVPDDFIGKAALKGQVTEGVAKKIVGFELLGKGIPREGYRVEHDGQDIGYVTTGYAAPTVLKSIGLALVDADFSALGTVFDVVIRNKKVQARVIKRKFL